MFRSAGLILAAGLAGGCRTASPVVEMAGDSTMYAVPVRLVSNGGRGGLVATPVIPPAAAAPTVATPTPTTTALFPTGEPGPGGRMVVGPGSPVVAARPAGLPPSVPMPMPAGVASAMPLSLPPPPAPIGSGAPVMAPSAPLVAAETPPLDRSTPLEMTAELVRHMIELKQKTQQLGEQMEASVEAQRKGFEALWASNREVRRELDKLNGEPRPAPPAAEPAKP